MERKKIRLLICSAGTREALETMINEFYYSDSYRIQDDGTVFNAKKNAVLDSTMVEQRRGRWRFGLI